MGRMYGSGVILGHRGRVVTAAHVVQLRDKSVYATATDGTTSSCTVIREDAQRDLALLDCSGFVGRNGVERIFHGNVPVGLPVAIVAAPGNLPVLLTTGVIAARLDPKGKLMISAMSGPGDSGGGIFALDGRLIGICQAIYVRPPFIGIIASNIQLRLFLGEKL